MLKSYGVAGKLNAQVLRAAMPRNVLANDLDSLPSPPKGAPITFAFVRRSNFGRHLK